MLEHVLEEFYLERLQKHDFEIGMPEYDAALAEFRATLRAVEEALPEERRDLVLILEEAHDTLADYRCADAFAEGFRIHRIFDCAGAGL